MRGVILDVPPDLLAERARLGHDRHDEMWEGELHMVPPASHEHQRISGDLYAVLRATIAGSNLAVHYETGVFDPTAEGISSYRVPDLVVFGPAVRSERGVEGAASLVIEIASPGDESLAKIPFYERVGVGEVLIIDRDTKALRHWVNRSGRLVETPDGDGVTLNAVPLSLTVAADSLTVTSPTGSTEI